MPRQRRSAPTPSRSAPSRPTVAPARPTPAVPQQQRGLSTTANPGQTRAAPQQAAGGGGMLSNIASTAAGVAIGSSIGHGISSLFGGGSSSAVEQVDPVMQAQAQDPLYGRACDVDAKAFTKCLDENRGEHAMSICGWYFDQLKACQQAAKQY